MNDTKSIEFNPSNNTYTYYDGSAQNSTTTFSSFDGSQVSGSPSNFETRRQLYSRSPIIDGSQEDLKLFLVGNSNSQVNLTYTSYGVDSIWSTSSPYEQRVYFYYGIPTPTSSLPITGTASHSGIAEGTFTDGVVPYRLTGSSTLIANFGAGTVTASLNLTGVTSIVGAAPFVPEQYSGLGTIGNQGPLKQFAGTLTGITNPAYGGSFSGSFFGPQAEEYGFLFSIGHGVPLGTPGAGVGVGVAVGK